MNDEAIFFERLYARFLHEFEINGLDPARHEPLAREMATAGADEMVKMMDQSSTEIISD